MCTLYEWSFTTIFTNISESKSIEHYYELELQRRTFVQLVFIPCPVAKAAGGPIGDSITLATETMVSPVVAD